MPHFLITGAAEDSLRTLSDALDQVDFGIAMLDRDMRVRFINQRCAEIWALPPDLMVEGTAFRTLLNSVAVASCDPRPAADPAAALDHRDAEVRAGAIQPMQIDLEDGRRLLFRCIACPDGGRVLTYVDISGVKREQELQIQARDAAERMGAELRFSNETLESQAAYLASLAEQADESAQKAEAARLQLEREVAERRQLEAKLRRMATTDALTGSLNRAQIMTLGQRELERVRQVGQGLAVLMVDVDHFKAINDRYGHATGDRALQHLVASLRAGVRRIDLVGRLGGEEFAVVLPAIPDEVAGVVAERLRARVADSPIAHETGPLHMTISIGLAIARETDHTIEQILARADAALYRAKDDGRNRVVTEAGLLLFEAAAG